MQALLDAVREACLPGLWSQGVQLARQNAVSIDQRDETQISLRVRVPGKPVAPTAIVYPEDLEWTCDCGSSIDPCAHVAAAAIALNKAAQSGESMAPVGRPEPRLRYHLRSERGYLAVQRCTVTPEGQETPLGDSIASPGTRERLRLTPTHDDLQIERLLLATRNPQFFGDRLLTLLRALSSCPDVLFEGEPVSVSKESIRPCAEVFDEGGAVVLKLVAAAAIDGVIVRGVVRCGTCLHPMAEMELSGTRLERLPSERRFSSAGLGELVTEILPELDKRVEVQVRSRRLPGHGARLRPRIAVDLGQQPGGLEVLPTLVYGDPPVARIDEGRLIHLGGDVPKRDEDAEKWLLLALRDQLNLVPGRRVRYEGADAERFAHRLDLWTRQESTSTTAPLAESVLVPHFETSGDRFELRFEVEGDAGEPLARAEPLAVARAWQNGLSVVPLDGGGWARLPSDWMGKYGDLMCDLLAATEGREQAKGAALAVVAEFCEALELPPPPSFARLRPLLEASAELPDAALPPDLTATLRPYQLQGVRWLELLRQAELGALLADDMGLGKTLQALCVMQGKTLVVCPRSVIHNWAEEAARFRPSLSVCLYHGPGRRLEERADLVLTTYATLRLDSDELSAVAWDAVVLDEAQNIKNPDSQAARAVFGLDARFRLALSGTPVENRLEELWSLMHFTNPGLLGGRSRFRQRHVQPITGGDSHAARHLQRRVRPFLLRRLKRDVLADLPPRVDVTLHVELSESERDIYEALRLASKKQAVELLQGGGNVMAALEALLRLRQAACHPALLPGRQDERSAKVDTLLEALDEAAQDGHKALVFSQWTSLLDLIEPELERLGLRFLRLDGKTRDRASVVAQFQDEAGPPILLTSLKAGGTGLNLTAADHVFLMDPWWNPAVEDQAADRAHRIGQQRSVLVHRLIARQTVEEGIVKLQAKKRELSDLAVADGDGGSGLSRRELLELLD